MIDWVGFYGTATLYRLYGAETEEKLPDPHPIYIEIKKYGVWSQKLNPCWRIRDAETPVYVQPLLRRVSITRSCLQKSRFEKIEFKNLTM